jgi:hypothetical protein
LLLEYLCNSNSIIIVELKHPCICFGIAEEDEIAKMLGMPTVVWPSQPMWPTSTAPKHLLLIKVITKNICVNRMAREGEYRKVARGEKC